MKIALWLPSCLALACTISSIVLVCIISAAGENANVTGSHGGRVLSPGMNILEFHVHNTSTQLTENSFEDDPYWAWKEGYMFRWFLHSAWMDPDFSSTETGAQAIYKAIGTPFNFTQIMDRAFDLAPGLHRNASPPVFDTHVTIPIISTTGPFACYIVGILVQALALLLRFFLPCVASRKGVSYYTTIGLIAILSTTGFATITAASGYLTIKSRSVGDALRMVQYISGVSVGRTFLGLTWGAVGASALNLALVAYLVRWYSADGFRGKEGVKL